MKKIYNVIVLLAAVCLMGFFSAGVSAESEYKLYDYADLLSDSEEEDIEGRLVSIAEDHGHDVIVFTTESMGGLTKEEYTEKLRDDLDAGIDGSGMIFLVAMDERKFDIYAFGTMRSDIFPDAVRDGLADDLKPYLSDGDYYSAFAQYADRCRSEIEYVAENGPNQSYQDMEGEPTFGTYAIAVGVAFVIAVIIMLVMKSGMKTTRPEYQANGYIRKNSFDLKESRDIFLYSSIVRTKRAENNNSGSDSGSSDSGHSGGDF